MRVDEGAHFFRADFQIHTPRDANWQGGAAVTEDQRVVYAREFVTNCRAKGLAAVAITDHHDVCLAPYIQKAAKEDEAIAEGHQPLIVFPGVEVLVQVNGTCQAIVLLDADADASTQEVLLHTMGVTPQPAESPKGPTVVALPFKSFDELDEQLRQRPELKGRYIILPNVTCGSHRSFLRDGAHHEYCAMPCFGGYLECHWAEAGRKSVLEGKESNYGNKALGIFQTSDYRGSSTNDIGSRSTWVKMAEPTAEALRQACLAHESRLFQSTPLLPGTYIAGIEVSDSAFMGKIDLALNPQFNAIIGGRGTGKSTLLEYLRWAMQDQPPSGSEEDQESYDAVSRKRSALVSTLTEAHGVVAVHWMLAGAPHIIRLDSATGELTLQIGDQPPQPTSADYVREHFPITAYSQKQLSTVSVRTAELQRFIEQPVHQELGSLDSSIEALSETIKGLYVRIRERQNVVKDLATCKLTMESLRQRADAIMKSLPPLSAENQQALNEHAARLQEEQAVADIRADLNSALTALTGTSEALSALPRTTAVPPTSPQARLLQDMHEKAGQLIAGARQLVDQAAGSLQDSVPEWRAIHDRWLLGQQAHSARYEQARIEAAAHKEKMADLDKLRRDAAEHARRAGELEAALSKSADCEADFEAQWTEWVTLHRRRGDILEGQCASLSTKSGGCIRAELVRGADMDDAMRKLEACLKGARIFADRWKGLRDNLSGAGSPVEAWRQFMQELRPLAEAEQGAYGPGNPPSPLTAWDLTGNQLQALAEKMQPDTWLDIALTSLNDAPRFHYVKGANEIPFANASAGEQATALLTVLLSESGCPLIIDQPEEDLDNAVIWEVVKNIWGAKQNRQIIIASHNANLVVNGDAELVVHCDHKTETDRSKGEVKGQGAIDVKKIRDAITAVMEGGQKAFELRKMKYGF